MNRGDRTAIDDAAAPAPGGGGTLAPIESDGGDGLHRPSGRAGLGLSLTLTTVVLWGMLPIGLKVALSGMGAFTLTWYRFVAAAIILGAILFARGARPPLSGLDRRGWLLLALATACLATNYVLYVVGLDRTNASTAQVVIQIAPVLLAVGGIWVFRERFGAIQWMGLGVMVTGLVVFSRDQIAGLLSDLDVYYSGVACITAAAISWSVYGLAQKQLLGHMSSPSVMLCIYIGGAVLFFPTAEPAQIASLTGPQLAALAFCVANMLIAYGTFAEALAHWEASRVSAVLAIVPLVTLSLVTLTEAVMPTLLSPEPITVTGVVGACMVVTGSLMTALARS